MAAQEGNLGKFEAGMCKYESVLLKNGTFLFMEKIKNIALRNLVKKVYEENKSNFVNKIQNFVSRYNESLEAGGFEDSSLVEDEKVDLVGME